MSDRNRCGFCGTDIVRGYRGCSQCGAIYRETTAVGKALSISLCIILIGMGIVLGADAANKHPIGGGFIFIILAGLGEIGLRNSLRAEKGAWFRR